MRSAIKSFDLHLTQFIQRLPESWYGLFIAITSLGDPIVTVGIGVIIVSISMWLSNTKMAIAGAMVWMTLIVGSGLKVLFARARPLSEYAANLRVDTFSFPSGHSSGAMVAYGLLAYIALKLLPQPFGVLVAAICGGIILAVGVSRVYLGAHFPSDVLAGWILGAAALGVIIFWLRPLA